QKVVRDGRVGRSLVGFVELDPGVEARLLERLHEPSRQLAQPSELLAELLEISTWGQQPRAYQEEPVVIGGDALHDPQRPGVVFLGVVERPERARADALDVPRMKMLVGEQLQQILIFLARAETLGRGGQRGRIAVLETTTLSGSRKMKQEEVA